MPIGVLTNSLAALAGILAGAVLRKVIPQKLKDNLPLILGFSAMAIGINSIIKVHNMTAVVIAVLSGFVVGQLLGLEQKALWLFRSLVGRLPLPSQGLDMELYITAVALFCCSGFGWYGVLTEAMAGDPGLLLSKSVLDALTAMVFAATLGLSLCAVPPIQLVIHLLVYAVGLALAGFLSPAMFADLSACGGVLTLATGFRVAKIKSAPIIDLMPALILVMPLSALFS